MEYNRISEFGTITLGGFIDAIEEWTKSVEETMKGLAQAKEEHIYFDFGWAIPTTLASHRGYYEHLGLGYNAGGDHAGNPLMSASDLLDVLKGAVGESYCGWKGGSFEMDLNTPVWADNSGHTSGTYILGMRPESFPRIHTCDEEDEEYWRGRIQLEDHPEKKKGRIIVSQLAMDKMCDIVQKSDVRLDKAFIVHD